MASLEEEFMRNKKWILFPLFLSLFLAGCNESDLWPTRVRTVPNGFVSLDDMLYGRDYIGHFFWSTDLVFVSPKDGTNNIFNVDVGRDDFIVMRNLREYFVNKALMLEILEYAENRDELVSRRYRLGDTIEIRPIGDIGVTREFTVFSVERISQSGILATYEIKFEIYPPMDTLQAAQSRFISFETVEPGRYTVFSIIDENTVHIRINSDKTPSVLIIVGTSPFHFEGHQRTIDLIGQY
jgi:hypothetical protein